MMVLPPLARVFNSDMHWKQEELSKPDVGSSKNMIGGLLTSSKAIDNRFFCPPDKFDVIVL